MIDPARLSAYIASRICHDLVSPVSSVTNALDLLNVSLRNGTIEARSVSSARHPRFVVPCCSCDLGPHGCPVCAQFSEQFGYLWDLKLQLSANTLSRKKKTAPRLLQSPVSHAGLSW